MDDKLKEFLKNLPKIDEILILLEKDGVSGEFPRNVVVGTSRSLVGEMRDAIVASKGKTPRLLSTQKAAEEVKKRLLKLREFSLKKVVNATGIILHTNLGRAPLSERAIERIVAVSRGYSNLEFNLEKGKRGIRYDHVRKILCSISGAEDAVIVNNNAAAVLLVLNTLSKEKEAIVSRGELIEIGGEFRIPEVMEKSGAILREVGTTNRTHLSDYENAIDTTTGLILKVHTSNFRTVGFTEEIGLSELVKIGNKKGIPVVNDLGSGCFVALEKYGFEPEPTVQEALATGVDVVTFSGDKLLGGPQAGIILGRKKALEAIEKNPLNRALRIDKLTLAALEATVQEYLNIDGAINNIRSLRALTEQQGDVKKRAEKLLSLVEKIAPEGFSFNLKEGMSLAGGGSLPTQEIPTVLLAVNSERISSGRLEKKLRLLEVPIISRIYEDEILFDLRTIDEDEFGLIEAGLKSLSEDI
ncbi:MAG: L-seryl-tRNA(Sec) selenium transferase [Deltaproteobacteria bacterium]|nr:L-seryl-tRNA(Sec) selenium transferase [Deltaproteobacteria bacterium]MBN2846120.1 L-seryl-tRNA(Sec) selenium transferase [Deltaproteobacteria bacterium]